MFFFFAETGTATMTNVTSFCMQFEKRGCGLLREAFQGKREWTVCWKRGRVGGGSVSTYILSKGRQFVT